ncbi:MULTISPECIES: DUF192 domain-containing protein [Aerosakkonema]|uniref:DUF192 domain-containing protein n=1 Tax=Aerosakkonema TaxID=1246629 RepID=UPI0035BA4CD8
MQHSKNRIDKFIDLVGVSIGCVLVVGSLTQIITTIQKRSTRETEKPIAYLVVDNRKVPLQIARTQREQARGLMYRDKLNGLGMLFPVHPPRVVSVWMKNVNEPLDILFVRQGKVVAIAPSVPPCLDRRCPLYKPPVPVDLVIELPAGNADRFKLSVGLELAVLTPTQPLTKQRREPTLFSGFIKKCVLITHFSTEPNF